MTPGQIAIAAGHALVGWAYCAALIGIGSQFMTMQATLIVHAIGAPLGFALVSWLYFAKFGFTRPLHTAGLFLAVVVGLDIFVVALFIEKSFAMFASPLGTWLPLGLIFTATYGVGKVVEGAREAGRKEDGTGAAPGKNRE